MSASSAPEWLITTVGAVRDLMIKRLEANSLEPEAKREMEMALEELDVMWEELQGQATLLMRENERYAEFFEYAPDAYLVTDAGGNIREANQAALELLKAPRAEVAGSPLSEYIMSEDRVSFLSCTVALVFGSAVKPHTLALRLQPYEGEPFEAELRVRAIPLKKSGVGGLCWLIRPAA